MTDRHAGYLVTLDTNIREDDAQAILAALRMVKHVVAVEPIIASMEVQLAETRARHSLRQRLYENIDLPWPAEI